MRRLASVLRCVAGGLSPLAVALLVLAHVAAAPPQSPIQTKAVPNANWVKIYFSAIDRLAGRMNLKPLRSVTISPGDVEVRVWEGFGIGPLQGFTMKRVGKSWSALSMIHWYSQSPRRVAVPKSTDWAGTWEKLQRGGIAAIRDDSEIPHCKSITDGVGYVVEIAKSDVYQTYLVNNPQTLRSEDGDRFLHLLPILKEAFGQGRQPDLAGLPDGEMRTVSSVSVAAPANPIAPRVPPWEPAGGVGLKIADLRLRPEDALAQGTNLRTLQCEESPSFGWQMHIYGDVQVEVLIQPDGTVVAARALSGQSLLAEPSIASALKWTFTRASGGSQTRGAVITITYREEWVPFPWMKHGR
jgi:hypothetical protein